MARKLHHNLYYQAEICTTWDHLKYTVKADSASSLPAPGFGLQFAKQKREGFFLVNS